LDSSSARNVYIDGSEAEMIFQTNLNGETLTPADPAKPWKSLGCTENCYTAKEKRCTCKCGGAFHGLGNAQHEHDGGQTLEQEWDYPPEEDFDEAEEHIFRHEIVEAKSKAIVYENLEAFRRQITRTTCTCGFEGLDKLPIEYYPHDGGWDIGYKRKQWLYVTCPDCEYQWALWKLGVSR